MIRKFVLCMFAILFSAGMAAAQGANQDKSHVAKQDNPQEVNQDNPQETHKNKSPETKELSGMSIVGNEDAPKSLYIVPWKSSEIGGEISLDTMLNEGDTPVDREVFKRQIEFYQISTEK